jgi:hypothetical protein
MADFDGENFTAPNLLAGDLDISGNLAAVPALLEGVLDISGGLAVIPATLEGTIDISGTLRYTQAPRFYKLQAQDLGSLPSIVYVAWISGTPTLNSYIGILPGGGPLSGLIVLDSWLQPP